MLAEHCVYAMKTAEELRASLSRGGLDTYTDGRKWTKAKQLLKQAKASRERLPVIFAVVEEPGLFAWALLEEIVLGETTTYTFSALRLFVQPPLKSTLTKQSDGEPLEEGNTAGYAICQTPPYLAMDQCNEPDAGESPGYSTRAPAVELNPAHAKRSHPVLDK